MTTETPKPLRDWRQAAGQTQKEAATSVGVHPVTWSEYERGKMQPRAHILRRIAKHFGCSSDSILLPVERGTC